MIHLESHNNMRCIILDINECARDHGCNHTCINTEGSYNCICDDGYMLHLDERNCTGTLLNAFQC